MPDDTGVSLAPVVSWPRTAEVGKPYLVTVDVRHESTCEAWPYDAEEYEIGCVLDGRPGLSVRSVGETTLVVHRFGGTYQPARFVAEALGAPSVDAPCELRLTLLTAGGLPFRTDALPVQVVPPIDDTADDRIKVPDHRGPRSLPRLDPAAPARGRGRRWYRRTVQVIGVSSRRADQAYWGCLIAPDLVLTTSTAVRGSRGVQVVSRVDKAEGPGRVVWDGADSVGDVALVRAPGIASDVAPVRWGRRISRSGPIGCRIMAMQDSWAQMLDAEIRDQPQPADGYWQACATNWPWPLHVTRDDRWKGMGGVPLFCGELLTGVVVGTRMRPPHRVFLDVLPAQWLCQDADFLAALTESGAAAAPLAEPLELPGTAGPPQRPAGEPDSWEEPPDHVLLAALDALEPWWTAEGTAARLLHGPGRTGKTRIAAEVARRLRADGYAAVWLDAAAPPARLRHLAEATVPILVVLDDVEARGTHWRAMLDRLGEASGGRDVKVLALGRHPDPDLDGYPGVDAANVGLVGVVGR
ncbi:hypothetical protein [Yinghuangia seranimata]|uniref:hypothetical protein n=1 Tax=Yinghuangia seranimata TaxID=408067 RepID=UPI00248BF6AF|nr:hypothetical protein [Yinghuangia seranimata]MDI2132801.1 hypothetical protein [Yinghuangia seranimata]